MTHHDLVKKAVAFLRSRGCFLQFTDIAVVTEIPDAIGWSWSWKNAGTIVVECKTSRADWLRDKHKRCTKKRGDRTGIGKMGDYRWFLVPKGLLTYEDVHEHFPDHGLIAAHDRGCRVIKEAPYRLNANKTAESYLLAKVIHNNRAGSVTQCQ